MGSIEIGRAPSGSAVGIDLPILVASRLLVQANSGAGKSWLIRRLLEQTFGHVQHIVIDPEGEFSSLRERFDYVLAGKGGETVAEPRSAKLLAHRLLELNASAIVDIYELKSHERVRFVRLFLEALVNAPRALWHPVLVVLDEAHVFAPQAGQAESADAVKDLATRGRKRGFCAILATQRLSKLHKDAAAELNNKLIGRSALDVDMKRAAEELGFSSRDDVLSLRTLEPGEFYAFGPALSPTVTRLQVGPVQTTHPEAGARLAFMAPPPTEKVRALLPQLADLPAEAEEEARTVESLRRELTDVRRRLTIAEKATEPKPCDHAIEISRLQAELEAERRQADRVYETFLRNRAKARDQLVAIIDGLSFVEAGIAQPNAARHGSNNGAQASNRGDRGTREVRPALVLPHREGGRGDRRPDAGVGGVSEEPRPQRLGAREGTALPKAQRAILAALAQYPQGRNKKQLALLTGYASNGGGFNNAIGALKNTGYVIGDKNLMQISDGVLDFLGPFEPLPTGAALLDYWRSQLPKAERSILTVLEEAYPEGLAKEEVAARAGYEPTGGGFNNALGKLRALELIERGTPRLSDDLYG